MTVVSAACRPVEWLGPRMPLDAPSRGKRSFELDLVHPLEKSRPQTRMGSLP